LGTKVQQPNNLKILIPSPASRFFPEVREFLIIKGLTFEISGRNLFWGMRNLDFFCVRGTDIPQAVENTWADVGITGLDIIAEKNVRVLELAKLGIRFSEIILASNKFQHVSDLPRDSIIATEYPAISRRYFQCKHIDVHLHPVSGASEGFGLLPIVSAIVTLKTSGETLAANGYVILDVLFKTQACLITNTVSLREKTEDISQLVECLIGKRPHLQ